MSKKTSISKRGGRPAGALRDVASHGNHVPKTTTTPAADLALDLFDALLPTCESSPQVAVVSASRTSTVSKQPTPPAPNQVLVASQPVPSSPAPAACPIENAVAQLSEQKAISSASEQVELIESLRYWECELRNTEIDLQKKADDLAARRRDFARQIRLQHRETKLTATAHAANKHASENAESTDACLAEMQSQIGMLVTLLRDAWPTDDHADGSERRPSFSGDESAYVAEIESLKSQVESLVEQNSQLASELAHLTVQRTVDQSSDATASLSWEERKELLFRQFESEDNSVPFDPQQLTGEQCSLLNHEMICMQQELRTRENEIAELRSLLEQRPAVQGNDLAVGAAAITRLFDDDELIREERSRLKEIQAEWEAKFRDMEIAASLERASLARERRQLECQNAELEEQLAHLKQELRQESIAGPAQSRRWFAKLGLGE